MVEVYYLSSLGQATNMVKNNETSHNKAKSEEPSEDEEQKDSNSVHIPVIKIVKQVVCVDLLCLSQ